METKKTFGSGKTAKRLKFLEWNKSVSKMLQREKLEL